MNLTGMCHALSVELDRASIIMIHGLRLASRCSITDVFKHMWE